MTIMTSERQATKYALGAYVALNKSTKNCLCLAYTRVIPDIQQQAMENM
jgi:hypothetical protein